MLSHSNHKPGGFHQQQTTCKDKKIKIKILNLQHALKWHKHTHWQRNMICKGNHWVQKQEWPSEYMSCRSARDPKSKKTKQEQMAKKLIHSPSTYRTTVSFLEHEGLQLELDLVSLGARHEAWAGSHRIHKAPDKKWWQNSMLTLAIKSLALTRDKIVKELLKAAKSSSAMTQCFLVMAKSTYNEERKSLVIDDS